MVKFRKSENYRAGNVWLEDKRGMENWRYIQPVLQKFAKRWDMAISARNPHGSASVPESDNRTLFIRFFSNSSTGRYAGSQMPFLPSAYGVRLEKDRNGDAMEPSGAGETITCHPGRRVIAEIVEGTLFVLFDLPHPVEYGDGRDSGSAVLIRRILEDFGRSESFRKMRSAWKPLPRGRLQTQKALEEICWTNFQTFFQGRRLNRERVRQRFEELKNAVEDHKGVLDINHEKIVVTFGPIWARYPKGFPLPLNIGRYDFVMYPTTGNVSVLRVSHGFMEHPNVSDDTFCLGNISRSMSGLVEEGNFDLAVALAYKFLTKDEG